MERDRAIEIIEEMYPGYRINEVKEETYEIKYAMEADDFNSEGHYEITLTYATEYFYYGVNHAFEMVVFRMKEAKNESKM
jgi:hypothetical protein